MRTTRNITIAIPEDLYRQARVDLARRNMSMSRAVSFLLQHLPAVDQAVRKLLEEEANCNALASDSSIGGPKDSVPRGAQFLSILGCETVKPLVNKTQSDT